MVRIPSIMGHVFNIAWARVSSNGCRLKKGEKREKKGRGGKQLVFQLKQIFHGEF
jgi:hypothetical protein